MKFTVEGKTFQQKLTAVSKVINAKNALAILDNFLLKIEGDQLSITGSDQENVLVAFMTVAESDGDGEFAVSAKRLLEITKEIPNQPLVFTVNEQTLEINLKFLNGEYDFMGVDGVDYPKRRELETPNTMILPASMVLKGIEYTAYAVAVETVRPAMTGIFWDIHNEDITFVASDTHKLVRYINREAAPGLEASFILPAKPANILKGLIGKDDADIKVMFDSKGAVFEVGDFVFSSLFVNGVFPNYNRVIPTQTPFELTIDRQSLLSALRRVSIFSPKSSNLVVVKVGDNFMQVSAQDLDYGYSGEERVPCDYSGNHMTIGFNGQFMIEILNVMRGDSVVIKLADPARPGVISPLQQEEGEDIVVIQMPMQTL